MDSLGSSGDMRNYLHACVMEVRISLEIGEGIQGKRKHEQIAMLEISECVSE